MFEHIKALPELEGLHVDALYRRFTNKTNAQVAEEAINVGVIDAWMECFEAQDFSNVLKKARTYAWRRLTKEWRYNNKHVPLLSKTEMRNGYVGVNLDADEGHCTDPVDSPKYSARGMSCSLKGLVSLYADKSMDKLMEYLRIGAERVIPKRPNHPEYDAVTVLANFYCYGKPVVEMYREMPSFTEYRSLTHIMFHDLRRLRKWVLSDEGRAECIRFFGVDPETLS